jgi:hypothetical protein
MDSLALHGCLGADKAETTARPWHIKPADMRSAVHPATANPRWWRALKRSDHVYDGFVIGGTEQERPVPCPEDVQLAHRVV